MSSGLTTLTKSRLHAASGQRVRSIVKCNSICFMEQTRSVVALPTQIERCEQGDG